MAILGRLVRLTLLAFVGVTAVSAVLALQRKRDAPPPPDPDADEIDLVAIFDELDFRSEAQAFRGGRVECWFGGGTPTCAAPRSIRTAQSCTRRPSSGAAASSFRLTGS